MSLTLESSFAHLSVMEGTDTFLLERLGIGLDHTWMSPALAMLLSHPSHPPWVHPGLFHQKGALETCHSYDRGKQVGLVSGVLAR